jgi:large subunit ribosomal protein L22
MSVKASAKSVAISPRKTGDVTALVRSRSVADALTILGHTPRGAALPVRKLIESARANAENNHGYKPDSLVISSIYVTPAARIKRWRAMSRGRANPYQKKSSHIFVEIDGDKREAKKPTAKKEAK